MTRQGFPPTTSGFVALGVTRRGAEGARSSRSGRRRSTCRGRSEPRRAKTWRSCRQSRVGAMTVEQLASYHGVVLLSTRGLERAARERLMSVGERAAAGSSLPRRRSSSRSVLAEMTGWQPPLTAVEQGGPLTLAATDVRHPIFRPFGALAANLGQVRVRSFLAGVVRRLDGRRSLLEWHAGAPRAGVGPRPRRCSSPPMSTAGGTTFRCIRRSCRSRSRAFATWRGTADRPRDYTVAEAPAEARQVPGVYRTAGQSAVCGQRGRARRGARADEPGRISRGWCGDRASRRRHARR